MHSVAKHSGKPWYKLSRLKAVPDFFTALRRTRRAVIGSIGIRGDSRGKGLIRAMDFSLRLVQEEGYEYVDTGPVLIDNAVVVKMVERAAAKYGNGVEQTIYYTLQYEL
jgi:hypothetical protein